MIKKIIYILKCIIYYLEEKIHIFGPGEMYPPKQMCNFSVEESLWTDLLNTQEPMSM